jgi:hypothetical protein
MHLWQNPYVMRTPPAGISDADWLSWPAGSRAFILAQQQELVALREDNEHLCTQLTSLATLCIVKCYFQLVSRLGWAFPLCASPFRLIASTPAAALLGLFAIP